MAEAQRRSAAWIGETHVEPNVDASAALIRVVVADNKLEARSGFRRILTSACDITVVGEAADGDAALRTVDRLHPDVLVADIRMPPVDGLQVCRRVAERRREGAVRTRVVVTTSLDIDEYVARALTHGSADLLPARTRSELLVEAVHAAMTGDMLISPKLAVRLLSAPDLKPPSRRHEQSSRLTWREIDVARSVASGRTNAQIAAELFITSGTVKTHLAHIQTKLGVKNRVGIAGWAWANDLVSPPEF